MEGLITACRLGYAITLIGQQLPWFWPLLGVVGGGITGSFLSCAADRLPRGRSLRQPPSACDTCHTRLTLPDLIPVVSWLWLKGRCRHCGTAYGPHNLIWEVTCMLVGLAWGLWGQPGLWSPLIVVCGLSGLALIMCGLWQPVRPPRVVHKNHTSVA